MPHLRRFESLTHEALGSLSHVSNVKFGPSLNERLDLFSAHETTERPPIVVFVHGGYWRLSDGNDYGFVARGLHRFAAVNVVNYTLAPKAPLGEIVRQVRAAITWTWHNAHRTGGDRDRIYVVGHSAGAHLTVMAALTDWAGEYGLPANLIKGVFAISGLYDLRPLPYSFVGPALQLTGRDILELSPMLPVVEAGLEQKQAIQACEDFEASVMPAGTLSAPFHSIRRRLADRLRSRREAGAACSVA